MAQNKPQNLDATLKALPEAQGKGLRSSTRQYLRSGEAGVPILVILDDDPTGTQTCHDITILTAWETPRLVSEFKATEPGSGFFILTNSRALHPPDARNLITEICTNLKEASRETGTAFEAVLRSDSTLRGHFPLELEATESVLGEADAWVVCPFFLQGGRYTIDDVHYVQEGDKLIPAGQTPFAKDATFGYQSSNLKDYVVEKGKGSISPDRVFSLTIDMIRTGGTKKSHEYIQETMQKATKPIFIVNAASDEDVDIVTAALLQASRKGTRFLFRTGAAFVSSRLAIEGIPPISATALYLPSNEGGLIIAGSYVPKTTSQLEKLTSRSGEKLTTVVLDVQTLLESPEKSAHEIANAVNIASDEIRRGQDVLVMTSRKLIVGEDDTKSLDIGSVVAKALVSFLVQLEQKPRYVIAKGGITSSDMATKGLRFKRALIVGQAAPGVPLWKSDDPSTKWPGIPYVVFPGNVGSEDTLFEVVDGWRTM